MPARKLLLVFFFVPLIAYAQLRPVSEDKLALVKIQLNSGEVKSGYLASLNADGISIFDPHFQQRNYATFHFSNIERLAVLKKGNFWKGLRQSFIFSEMSLILLSLDLANQEDNFSHVFILGNLLFAAPVSLIGGLSAITPKVQLDISDSEQFAKLSKSKIIQYAANGRHISISNKGIEKLDAFHFSNKNLKRLQLNYSPKIYVRALGAGMLFTSINSQVLNQYKQQFDDSFREKSLKIPLSIGFAFSPFKKWEFGYSYQNGFTTYVGFDTYSDNGFHLAGFDFIANLHQVEFLYRIQNFTNGFGNNWQFSVGPGLSLLNIDQKALLAVNNYDASRTYGYTKNQLIPGASAIGTIDYFLSRNISIQTNFNFGFFGKMKLDQLSASGFTMEASEIHPRITSFNAALRFQL